MSKPAIPAPTQAAFDLNALNAAPIITKGNDIIKIEMTYVNFCDAYKFKVPEDVIKMQYDTLMSNYTNFKSSANDYIGKSSELFLLYNRICELEHNTALHYKLSQLFIKKHLLNANWENMKSTAFWDKIPKDKRDELRVTWKNSDEKLEQYDKDINKFCSMLKIDIVNKNINVFTTELCAV